MVRRVVWGALTGGVLSFLFALPAYAGPKEAQAYYGKELAVAEAQGGADLRDYLFRTLSRGHTAIGYKKAREFLFGEFYLVRQGGRYGVKDVYCQRVAADNEFRGDKPGPGQIPDHRTVNAEHTWPQSQFSRTFPGEDQKSDMHHLFPTDSEMNSKRSSLEFGDVVSRREELKCAESRLGVSREGADVFEPPAAHKGNVARALFYFSVRYRMKIENAEESDLREWHRMDPVDEEERDRNERIFRLQGNRNPFVDQPELADKIADF